MFVHYLFWIIFSVTKTPNRFGANGFVLVNNNAPITQCVGRSSSPASRQPFFLLEVQNENIEEEDEAVKDNSAGRSDDDNADVPMTPCNRICRYNADFYDGQVCIGCYRETYEIANWASMDSTERYWVLLDAIDRIEEGDNLDGGVDSEELIRQAKYWEQKTKSSS